ncbi:hypothetical protein B0J12DRAFT_162074 [Macrophomina phaseolina]|uniref:Uncharacterized protein n=1 Tax=Macrophomina phaseolina TaxID=35725 RepID=A0ABQ8GRW2_9PEZI|nr:hypothetical protein B0J12DRAFT_162074 [Macrophomina phaseolina]
MADESLRNGNLHQEELNADAKAALNEIVKELSACRWEERDGDGLFQKVKLGDLPKFSDHVSKICRSCKVVPDYFFYLYILTRYKINSQYGYGILRYDKTEAIPLHPSDRFTIVVPLELDEENGPKIIDQDQNITVDLAVGWVSVRLFCLTASDQHLLFATSSLLLIFTSFG